MGQMHHLHPFFQKFLGDPEPPPPLLREDKKFPSLAFPWSTAKVKIFPHHVYRRSEIWKRKLHTIFGGKNRHELGKNGLRMHHLHPFFKNFLGETPTPPPPYCEKIKNFPSLAFYDLLQLRWKFSHITYIQDQSFEGKNYTQFFGEKSTRTRQKKWAQNAPFDSIFQKFSRGRPPGPPPTGGGIPLPPPSPCGASHRLCYPPRQWTIWIRHCLEHDWKLLGHQCLKPRLHWCKKRRNGEYGGGVNSCRSLGVSPGNFLENCLKMVHSGAFNAHFKTENL